ncbi:small EDRK-rich factor 1 [Gymnogyps californianus]|uniref:small EDRK-rich factor 1 n=1 Tax=Gymnogyps californianus TaxID=33616 RepID=UPI0021C5719B|nr:small EDRK-rich factor 1 [Gymnogyps californianus]
MLQNVENSTISLGARDTHSVSQVKYWGQTVLGNVYLEAGMVQYLYKLYYLTGGNQRELARQKNLKKTQEIHKGKRKEDSLSASQRKQRDSEIMQQKQKAANERKSLQAGAK